jgi:hypothetical protein
MGAIAPAAATASTLLFLPMDKSEIEMWRQLRCFVLSLRSCES